MTPYGQLLRFHSVAEFSSYCTSVLSLSYNASNTKYSTRGVRGVGSSRWYRYNNSNNKYNVRVSFSKQASLFCLHRSAQTQMKTKKVNNPKTKSFSCCFLPFGGLYTRAAHVVSSSIKDINGKMRVSTSRFNPPHVSAVQSKPGIGGWADVSQVVGGRVQQGVAG